MAFKFPFTNYHELNLTWVLEQLKKLFEESAENVSVIQNYDGRLTVVETELPTVSETASEASRAAAAAGTLAQTAKATADTAQENAVQAQSLAGTARQEAQNAQTAADAATQAAQQAQATAQNFDGRITQAEQDAATALEASRSFENRVQAAITTANNAAQTATNAQGIATRADQNAGAALDKIGDLSALDTTAKQNLVSAINEVFETGGGGGDCSDCAPLIINTASGAIASFSDGADNRQISKIVATIEPVQSGTGDPSPDNVRPISGWTQANIYNEETYDASATPKLTINWQSEAGTVYGGKVTLNDDGSADVVSTHVVYNIQPSQWTWQSSSSCFSIGRSALSPRYKVFGNNVDNRIPDIVCNKYKPNSFNNMANSRNSPNYSVGIREHNASWLVLRTNGTNRISPEECQIKLPLATPQTYHFDNIGQLKTFLGTNNVWINTGRITECLYPADTKLYIDGKIAELQALVLENNG